MMREMPVALQQDIILEDCCWILQRVPLAIDTVKHNTTLQALVCLLV